MSDSDKPGSKTNTYLLIHLIPQSKRMVNEYACVWFFLT